MNPKTLKQRKIFFAGAAALLLLPPLLFLLIADRDLKPGLDATFDVFLKQEKFDELVSYLSRKQIPYSLAAPLGVGRTNLSYIQYLKARAHYEQL